MGRKSSGKKVGRLTSFRLSQKTIDDIGDSSPQGSKSSWMAQSIEDAVVYMERVIKGEDDATFQDLIVDINYVDPLTFDRPWKLYLSETQNEALRYMFLKVKIALPIGPETRSDVIRWAIRRRLQAAQSQESDSSSDSVSMAANSR